MEPEIRNIPFKEYLGLDRVSNSYLSKLASVPAKAKIKTEETPSMAIGTAFHAYVLERNKFSNNIAVAPKVDRRTKAGKETWANFMAENAGKAVITEQDFLTVQSMSFAIDAHPMASHLLLDGIAEQSVLWTDKETGIKCKARPDFITDPAIIDLKSTRDASVYGFMRSVMNFRYFQQAAMYLDAINAIPDYNQDEFIFIAVESSPPFRVECYNMSIEFLEYGYFEYHRLLNLEKACREDGYYPHYSESGTTYLEKPKYL